MWQGRAQGLQQQLDQAVQDKQQLQLSMGAAQAAVNKKQQSVRWVWLAVGIVCCHRNPDFLKIVNQS